jgi:hypothetical protein
MVVDGEVEHIEGGVPPGCDIARHDTICKLQLLENCVPRW